MTERTAVAGLADVDDTHWTAFHFLEDPVLDDQFRHYLSLMLYGMSDLGECLEVARQLELHDEDRWLSAWTEMAERIQARAAAAERGGKTVSASSAYLRAATYWRASLMHFSFREDPRVRRNALAAKDCYERYLELSGYPGEYVEIPYEGSFLPAHFYRSPTASDRAPVLIMHQGRDAWPEDTRWVYEGAIRRGIHCLAFHGPGQGLALRLNGLPFRYDWEKAVTPVVDFVVDLPGVDPERVALMGLSFGGYLAPRAAAFEKRIRVCIADPGVLDWGRSVFDNLPPHLSAAFDAGAEAFDSAVATMCEGQPLPTWFIRDSLWKYGVSSPYELFQRLIACDLTEIAGQITCETLVMDGTSEVFTKGEAQKLYDALTCPKSFMLFEPESTAQLHCQNGGNAVAAERLFDWLDERLV